MNKLDNVIIHLPSKLHKLPVIEFTKDTRILEFTIKAGFKTDGATIPWIFRRWFPSIAAYTPAAIVHDVYCEEANREKSYEIRRAGDEMFYMNMVDRLNRPKLEAMFLYAGVTIGSMWAWVRYKL
jgi:hypothetical protein